MDTVNATAPNQPNIATSTPAEWQGECGLIGPFESRNFAQTFASFRVDFNEFIVQRTFARGDAWYLELVRSQAFDLSSNT